MNARNLKANLCSIALTVAGIVSMTNAHAWQDIAAANANFDAQFNRQLSSMQQQTNNSLQEIWQQHLRVNGSRLQAQYRQLVASGQAVGTFEQFAYWDLMSAGGRDNAGALRAQRNQIEGMGRANDTIRSRSDTITSGYWDRSARVGAVMDRGSEARRGNATYADPHTGAAMQLPYSLPQGQTVTVNGSTYAQDPQGNYWRHDGNNYWSRIQAGR